jgi:hypothetical protein
MKILFVMLYSLTKSIRQESFVVDELSVGIGEVFRSEFRRPFPVRVVHVTGLVIHQEKVSAGDFEISYVCF